MSRVRLADITDIKRIHELAQELLADSVYAGIKMDDKQFKLTVAGLIGSKTGAVFVIVDEDDTVQGFLLGIIDNLFFSRARYATDLATYVRPAFRAFAPFMFRRFTKWARSKPGVAEITLGISSGIGDTERVGRFYQRLGYQPVGGLYVMRVSH